MNGVNLCTAVLYVPVYCAHVVSGIEQSTGLWRDMFFDVKFED